MPKYMLLLYAATETSREEAEQRESEMPLWIQYYENLRDAGLLVHTDRLHSEDAATTVRVWDNETEITDGPFATTKEFLRGYYVLQCRDLDQALEQAAKVPLARYGSVEVRPIVDFALPTGPDQKAAANAET